MEVREDGWERGDGGKRGRRNGATESIRRYARLNERNVNHKKLRAFKSPTRWCTFALITLHLSFLLRATLSTGGGSNSSVKRTSSFSHFASLSLSLSGPPLSFLFCPSTLVPRSFSHLHSSKTDISWSFSSPSLFLSPPLFPYAEWQLFRSWKLPAANRSPSGPYALGDN